MASQRGSIAGPMARNVPCERSPVAQMAKAAIAIRARPAKKFCGERIGPRRVTGAGPWISVGISSLSSGRPTPVSAAPIFYVLSVFLHQSFPGEQALGKALQFAVTPAFLI